MNKRTVALTQSLFLAAFFAVPSLAADDEALKKDLTAVIALQVVLAGRQMRPQRVIDQIQDESGLGLAVAEVVQSSQPVDAALARVGLHGATVARVKVSV